MVVAVLIGIMIAIVVGVSLIGPITTSLQSSTVTTIATTAASSSPSVGSTILGVLPYILVAVILVGAVAWMGFHDGSEHEPKTKANSRNLISRVMDTSSALLEYQNNLDELLGIVTNQETVTVLVLDKDTLQINDVEYDWYLTAKHSTELAFKVVGLHKTDRTKNVVYILGKNSTTKLPYLIQEKDVEGALERLDNIGITLPGSEAEANSAVLGMINVMIGASLMPAINKITEDIVRGK